MTQQINPPSCASDSLRANGPCRRSRNVFCENAPGNRAAADEIVSQQRTNRHRFGVFVFGSSGATAKAAAIMGKTKRIGCRRKSRLFEKRQSFADCR